MRIFLALLLTLISSCDRSKTPKAPNKDDAARIAQPEKVLDGAKAPKERPATKPKGPTGAGWSMDPKSLTAPDTPVAGRIGGQEFRPDKVVFNGKTLTFRQGKEFFADREITVMMLGSGDTLEGLKLEVAPVQGFGDVAAQVNASWKKTAGDQLPTAEVHLNKFVLKLELGKIEGGKLAGKIYLCLPDATKSYLAGTFTLNAEGLGTAKVHGKITLEGEPQKQYRLSAGYCGRDIAGKDRSGYAGFTVTPDSDGYVESDASRLTSSKKDGCSFRHLHVLPGTYLVFVGWDKTYLDWRWVEVKDRGDLTIDLAVDPGKKGDLKVTLPADAKDRRVNLIPLDAEGKLSAKAGPTERFAMQLSVWVNGLTAMAPAGQDSVSFTGLKAGRYRVVAGRATADVEVKAKAAATVELK
jgi:hypothetical protein